MSLSRRSRGCGSQERRMRRSRLCRVAGMVITIAGVLFVLRKLKFVQISRWRRQGVKCHHRDVANFLEDTVSIVPSGVLHAKPLNECIMLT